MKIKKIKKFMISMLITSFIVLFILLLSEKTFSHGEAATKVIYISDGDTLWNIALTEQNNNKYYENKNVREIIQDIKHLNNLSDSYIYEGQKIEIPIL